MDNIFNKKFIFIFILIQPVLDLLTSFMVRGTDISLTIGIIARTLFVLYISAYIILSKNKSKETKIIKLTLISLFIYLFLFLLIAYNEKGMSMMISEVKGVIKTFYFPIVTMGMYLYSKDKELFIEDKTLIYVLLGYTTIIFISTITKTNFNSYRYGLGTVGWFYAANEIGAIIGILAPFTIAQVILGKYNVINMMATILCIFSIVYMGTKVPLLAFFALIVYVIMYIIIVKIFNKVCKKEKIDFNIKKAIIGIMVITIFSVILFYKSPSYVNIINQYGEMFNKILHETTNNNTNEIIKENNMEVSSTEKTESNSKDEGSENEESKNEESKNEVVNALLSNRTIYLIGVKENFANSNIINKLMGIGYFVQIEGEYSNKTIEIDYLDIFYRHGILGTSLYFLPLLIVFRKILSKIKLKKILDLEVYLCIFSILLGFGIASFAGHVFTAPAVSSILLFIIIKMNMRINSIE